MECKDMFFTIKNYLIIRKNKDFINTPYTTPKTNWKLTYYRVYF
jgi:hypothetical protein